MKPKSTMVLAGLLLALAAYVYFYEIKGEEDRQAAKEKASKVFLFEQDSVKSLELQPSNIHLVKEMDEWKIDRPINDVTDHYAVDSITKALEQAKVERVVAKDSVQYETYGLSDASPRIIFAHDSRVDTLSLGAKNPTSEFVYARKNSAPGVFLTSTDLLYNANKSLFDLRDKNVLKFENADVKRVILQIGKQTFAADQVEGDWQIKQPGAYRGDKSAWDRILNKVKSGRIIEFVEDRPTNLKKYGLEEPALQLRIVFEDGQKALLVGEARNNKRYYAKVASRNSVFLIDTTLVRTLDRMNLFELRDKQILSFKDSEVNKIVLAYPDSKIVCQTDSLGNWQIVEPEEKAAKYVTISGILTTLNGLSADGFVDQDAELRGNLGFEDYAATISVTGSGGVLGSVIVGAEKGQQRYLKNLATRQIFLVNKEKLNTLFTKVEDIEESSDDSKS